MVLSALLIVRFAVPETAIDGPDLLDDVTQLLGTYRKVGSRDPPDPFVSGRLNGVDKPPSHQARTACSVTSSISATSRGVKYRSPDPPGRRALPAGVRVIPSISVHHLMPQCWPVSLAEQKADPPVGSPSCRQARLCTSVIPRSWWCTMSARRPSSPGSRQRSTRGRASPGNPKRAGPHQLLRGPSAPERPPGAPA